MPFPNLPEKYSSEPVIHPEDLLAVRQQQGKFPNIPPPDGIIFCMRADLLRRLRWRIRLQKVGRTLGDIHMVRRSHGQVGVASNFGIGAPALAAFAEEMIAWGVKRFILLSWGGALRADLQTGDIVLADKAIRDEGVSHHYLPPEKYAYADIALQQKLASCLNSRSVKLTSGTAWTTDAPYRETKAEVMQYQSENAQVVEMETAGLYALAKARNVQAASIVIAADSLADLTWRPPADMKAIDRAFEICFDAAVNALCEEA
jgi:uridine phosphorylase